MKTLHIYTYYSPNLNFESTLVGLQHPNGTPQVGDKLSSMTDVDGHFNHGTYQPGEIGEAIASQKQTTEQAWKMAMDSQNNPLTGIDTQQGMQEAMQMHDERVNAVKQQTTEHVLQLKDTYIRPTFDEYGNADVKTVRQMMADMDRDNEVEVENRGFFARLFTGTLAVKQSQNFGESQLHHLLAGLNMNQLQELFQRITNKPMPSLHQSNYFAANYGEGGFSRADWTMEVKNAMSQFHEDFKSQLEGITATLSLISGDVNMRAGLATLVNGNFHEVAQKLVTPEVQNRIKTLLANGESMKENVSFLEQVAAFLVRVGLSASASIISGGILNVRTESITNSAERYHQKPQNGESMNSGKNGENAEMQQTRMDFSLNNLRITRKIGEKGVSGSINLDLAGITLEANLNDHTRIIDSANQLMAIMPNKAEATEAVIQYMKEVGPQDSDAEMNERFQKLTDEYRNAQNQLMTHTGQYGGNETILQNLLLNNTNLYASRVQEMNGFEFKGLYANAGLNGFAFGIQGQQTSVGGTHKNVNSVSSAVEAQANSREIQDAQLEATLLRAGVQKNERGNYVLNGQEIIPGPNQQIRWDITELVDTHQVTYQIGYELVDASYKVEHTKQEINLNNIQEVNEYIQKHPQQVADFLLKIRGKISGVQKLISDAKYDVAKTELLKILEGQYKANPVSRALISEIQGASNDSLQLQVILDDILAKTSGGTLSRQMARAINENRMGSKEVFNYYTNNNHRILNAFARQYGINPSELLPTVQALSENAQKENIKTLGSVAPNGFTAMVAYSQMNGGRQGLRTIDRVHSVHTNIIGNPQEVTGNMAEKIRQTMMTKISDAEIQQLMSINPILQGKNAEEIRQLMTSGTVKAYLSFEPYAECFNLGFVIEPGSMITEVSQPVQITNRLNQGSTVLHAVANSVTYGIGFGTTWNKTRNPPEPDTPLRSTPTPGRESIPNVRTATNTAGEFRPTVVSNLTNSVQNQSINAANSAVNSAATFATTSATNAVASEF